MGTRRTPFLPVSLDDGVPGVEGGGGVGGGDAVAGVAADGAGVADLGAAHHVHRLAQHVDVLLDQGIGGDVAEGGEAADAEDSSWSSRDTPRISRQPWMLMRAFPARLPSRICTSTSVPPAMIWASGCSSRRRDGVLDAFGLIER